MRANPLRVHAACPARDTRDRGADARALGIAGTELPGVITAAVRFSDGTGVAGVEVTFTVDVPGATATPASARTDATGRARTTWRLGSTVGQQRLTISGKPGGGFYSANPPVTVVALAEAAPS
ncbi:MAG: Ig-like domain-containing protein [Gemmatimonadetes bacterium]|nr:Ig-like domain-containing protein [Gemmatimonadota bacterium]